MNKDNVRKYINDIQIAMGKILEEMDAVKEFAVEYNNIKNPMNSLEASIPEEERSTIADILNNNNYTPIVEEGLTAEELVEKSAYAEMGMDWPPLGKMIKEPDENDRR